MNPDVGGGLAGIDNCGRVWANFCGGINDGDIFGIVGRI